MHLFTTDFPSYILHLHESFLFDHNIKSTNNIITVTVTVRCEHSSLSTRVARGGDPDQLVVGDKQGKYELFLFIKENFQIFIGLSENPHFNK